MPTTSPRSDRDHTHLPNPSVELSDADRESDWLDHLVELHVLAEHGDASAAASAADWIAVDEQARQVWESLDRLRDQLPPH
jgi:hypothetical protein